MGLTTKERQVKNVIGMDVSKGHVDLVLLDEQGNIIGEQRVANEVKAMTVLLKDWQRSKGLQVGTLVCLEATGHYGFRAIMVCMQLGLRVWVAHPLDIQLSLGMQRGKNDKVDARRIARYAQKHPEKELVIQEDHMRFEEFKTLLSSREFFVRERAKCQGQLTDNVRFLPKGVAALLQRQLKRQIKALDKSIAELQAAITKFIQDDQRLRTQCELAVTVPGIGPVIVAEVLALTKGFTCLMNPRKFSCYAGMAPFEHSSGSSIRGRTRVSHRANKRIKSLLHLAAMAAIRSAGTLRDYYHRKCAQGKHPMSVLNAVGNKIIHHLFAVLRSGRPYQPSLQEP